MLIPPAMWEIYDDDHPFIIVRKPSQVGATEMNLNLGLWAADTGYAGRGVVLVALPTQEMGDRISQARFAKAINESPYLSRRARPEASLVREPANVHRRRVGDGVIYFVGSEQETQYSGIDADIVICDEFDLMKEGTLSLVQARTRSSRAGRIVVTSTPTVEAFGVSDLYDKSDARRYELKCPSCGYWQTPAFPDSVDWDRTCVVCLGCSAPLDPWDPGRWVPGRPAEQSLRGYQLNRLVLPNPPLEVMKMAMEGKLPTTKETFYRQDLGQPWVSEDARLSLADLDATVADIKFDRRVFWFRRMAMGVDVGKKLHVVIRGYFDGRWLLALADTFDSFAQLDELLDQYDVDMCVIDSLPETRAASDFYRRHKVKVRLCRYATEGIAPHWDFIDHVGYVRVPRTLAMDEWLHMFKTKEFAVPSNYRELSGGDYVAHLLAPVRVTEPDAFGQPFATFKHTRPDDFAHAEVYCALATTRARGGGILLVNTQTMSFHRPDGEHHPDLKFRHRWH